MARFHSLLKRTLAVLIFVILLLASYFTFTSPAAYKISTTISFVDDLPKLKQQDSDEFVDIRDTISKIPYSDDVDIVYVPKPEMKYIRTILYGRGNCSNMAFGLMYKMLQKGDNYQIVHIMQPGEFLNGIGHTVVNMPYDLDGSRRYGIVDIFYAGIPTRNGEPLSFEMLHAAKLKNPSIISLNKMRAPRIAYYEEFLDQSVLAVIQAKEVKSYFEFLNSIYMPLGDAKLEKYFYETTAFVLGKYPAVCVAKNDYQRLYAGHKTILYLALSLTWAMRLVVILTPVFVVTSVFTRFKPKRKAVAVANKKHNVESQPKNSSEKKLLSLTS